ncbi:MAG: hypothetical protein E7361_00360 [Clostridiales bacterium]|nr:hypothetical protein [Clostridiales bacterium]
MLRGSIPPTGIPLPFISAGGSGLIVFLSAIGILLNIAMNSDNTNFRDFRLNGV